MHGGLLWAWSRLGGSLTWHTSYLRELLRQPREGGCWRSSPNRHSSVALGPKVEEHRLTRLATPGHSTSHTLPSPDLLPVGLRSSWRPPEASRGCGGEQWPSGPGVAGQRPQLYLKLFLKSNTFAEVGFLDLAEIISWDSSATCPWRPQPASHSEWGRNTTPRRACVRIPQPYRNLWVCASLSGVCTLVCLPKP